MIAFLIISCCRGLTLFMPKSFSVNNKCINFCDLVLPRVNESAQSVNDNERLFY